MHGNDEDFEEWKIIIVYKETKGLEFVYFAPHDDWKSKPSKPEPKEVQKEQTPKPKNNSTQQSKQNSNLTPGEIQAIKAMRGDPNIPEDAKPPLPEGY